MITVKILKTKEVKEVSNNVAFGLIDSGKAIRVYKDKIMSPKRRRKYKIK